MSIRFRILAKVLVFSAIITYSWSGVAAGGTVARTAVARPSQRAIVDDEDDPSDDRGEVAPGKASPRDAVGSGVKKQRIPARPTPVNRTGPSQGDAQKEELGRAVRSDNGTKTRTNVADSGRRGTAEPSPAPTRQVEQASHVNRRAFPRQPILGEDISPGMRRDRHRSMVIEGDSIWDETPIELDGSSECGGGGCGGCVDCCLVPCPRIPWENLQLFAGVQGFTGPANRGESGSFGFHEGANIGGQLPWTPCGEIGWQLGVRTTQNNLSRASFSQLERDQTFVTSGLFRRVDWGLQGGVVVDWLNENWYFTGNFLQLRGELSWVFPCRHELGFWFSSQVGDDQVRSTVTVNNQAVLLQESYGSTDLYAFFYRRRFGECDASLARIFAGFSGDGDGLIGADTIVPICGNWGFQAAFSYLVPNEGQGVGIAAGHAQESWNLALSLVFTPGCFTSENYFRPLFGVADNGNFMLDRN